MKKYIIFIYLIFFISWTYSQPDTTLSDKTASNTTPSDTTQQNTTVPIAKKGVLDLQNWDFNDEGNINLNVEWAFYPDMFVDPAHLPDMARAKDSISPNELTTAKYGSYVLKLNLPAPENPNTPRAYGITINKTLQTYELYIDGELIAKNGHIKKTINGKLQTASKAIYKPQTIFFLASEQATISLLFTRSYNIDNAADDDIETNIDISLSLDNFSHTFQKNQQEKFFYHIILSIMFLASLYYIINFALEYNSQPDITKADKLFFSLYAFSFGMAQLLISPLTPALAWHWHYRLRHMSNFGISTAALYFLSYMFKEEFSGRIFRIFIWSLNLCLLFGLFAPAEWTQVYSWMRNIHLASLIYMLIMSISTIFAQRQRSFILVFGVVFSATIGVIVDIFTALNISSPLHFNSFGQQLNSLAALVTIGIFVLIIILKQIETDKNLSERTNELILANTQIASLNSRLKSENLRMEGELETTRRLQDMLLPSKKDLNVFANVDIATIMIPASEVGGDYYDILWHDKKTKNHDHFTIGIGDITGHGLESGMLMLMAQMGVRTLLDSGMIEPKQVVNSLNKSLYSNVERMKTNRTLTFGLLDYRFDEANQKGNIVYCGQHETLIVLRKDGKVEEYDTMDLGFPLALEEDILEWLNTLELDLASGDGVILYTDGITEAENPQGDFYGNERFLTCLQKHWHKSATVISAAILQDIRAFVDTKSFYDDITLVILKQV